jgi:hypothetical protein
MIPIGPSFVRILIRAHGFRRDGFSTCLFS